MERHRYNALILGFVLLFASSAFGQRLATAVANVGAKVNGGTVYISNVDTISASLTIPDSVSLYIQHGGGIYRTNVTDTVFVKGPFKVTLTKVFYGADAPVVFDDNTLESGYWPEWWGSNSFDSSDDTGALLSCLNSMTLSASTGAGDFQQIMNVSNGTQYCDSTLEFPTNSLLRGFGATSKIAVGSNFVNTGDSTYLIKSFGALESRNGNANKKLTIRDVYFDGLGRDANGILLNAEQASKLENVWIDEFDQGKSLAIYGSQDIRFEQLTITHGDTGIAIYGSSMLYFYGLDIEFMDAPFIKTRRYQSTSPGDIAIWGGHFESGIGTGDPAGNVYFDFEDLHNFTLVNATLTVEPNKTVFLFDEIFGSTAQACTYTIRDFAFKGDETGVIAIADSDRVEYDGSALSLTSSGDFKSRIQYFQGAGSPSSGLAPAAGWYGIDGNISRVSAAPNTTGGRFVASVQSTGGYANIQAFAAYKAGNSEPSWWINADGVMEWSDGTTAALATLKLADSTLTTPDHFEFGEHLTSNGTAPSGTLTSTTLNDGGGSGASIALSTNATDTKGRVTITAGNGTPGVGIAGQIAFNGAYAGGPDAVILHPLNAAAADNGAYVNSISTTGFQIYYPTAAATSEVAVYAYFVIE